ncbi:G2/mitotic-specific cyclin-4 [Venturia nashicola]|uniref:G2/mitotic-specific cyclin-4 n=1 Tax=Venturia nashicola TaxID=86259 RepID=A0A4Z1NUX7_9PEZI|nr:G2/mitotic-specific cyclin-4 [Venturia nashicola]
MNLLDRIESLPLELCQQICEYAITPFEEPEAPLGYIVDPLVCQDFRYQRDRFERELECLKRLGGHVLSRRELDPIEQKWRQAWEASMTRMIAEDKEEWRKFIAEWLSNMWHSDWPWSLSLPFSVLDQTEVTGDLYEMVQTAVGPFMNGFGRVEDECSRGELCRIVEQLREVRMAAFKRGRFRSSQESWDQASVVKTFVLIWRRCIEIAELGTLDYVGRERVKVPISERIPAGQWVFRYTRAEGPAIKWRSPITSGSLNVTTTIDPPAPPSESLTLLSSA